MKKERKIFLKTSVVQNIFFSDTFLSISRQAKKILNKTFYGGPSHRCPKYCVCLLQPLTLIVSMDWRFEVILISAGCAEYKPCYCYIQFPVFTFKIYFWYRYHKRICNFKMELTELISTLPLKTVPVITVPCPLIPKQWSTENINGPLGSRLGKNVSLFRDSIISVIP